VGVFVKRLTSLSAASLFLLGTVSLGIAYSATAQEPSKTGELASNNRSEVTGCLQPTDIAREYSITDRDGNVWEISTDRDVYLNNYVGMTVKAKGDLAKSNNQVDYSQETTHRLHATNLIVLSQFCQQ
jgi:hypothetical protein